jgi:hypothetical protein
MLLGLLTLPTCAPAPPGPAPRGLERNRRLLARWKEDPAHYARLKADLQAFEALPPDRRATLRQLDDELHDQDPVIRTQLWHVMDRYATWLDRLPTADRDRILAAPSAAARVRLIHDLREQEWQDRLPKARREQLAKTPPEQRPALLEDFRHEERERRLEWQGVALVAGPEWHMPPTRLDDLPPDVLVALGPEEKERLRNAEGPLFGRTLLDLVEKRPVGMPGPTAGVSRIKDLPRDLQNFVRDLPNPARRKLVALQGHWPAFAVQVTKEYRERRGPLPDELGPCRPNDFAPPVQRFLSDELLPRLNPKEKQRLSAAEGQWPEYPREVVVLARRHDLPVPGLVPPGPRGYWEKLRAAVAAQGP